jgi:hypothetical protein
MKNIAIALTATLALAPASHALAQAGCSSDGATRPMVLFERFINADCADCWTDPATPAPSGGTRTVALDWIVPGAGDDDAPLSAAATRDGLIRLADLGRQPPKNSDAHILEVGVPPAGTVRVASGPPFNEYLGTSISWQPAGKGAKARGPWHYQLLLVEAIPAGTEGSTVARNIVRNMLQGTWDAAAPPSRTKRVVLTEPRPMRIPDGAKPERLFMVGWVQDAQGQTVAAARSVCR